MVFQAKINQKLIYRLSLYTYTLHFINIEFEKLFYKVISNSMHRYDIMRSNVFIGFFIVVLTLSFSCKKDTDRIRFDMIYPEVYFTIPAGLNPFLIHYIEIKDLPLNKSFFFNLNEIKDSTSVKILPRNARISSFLGDVDFDFIDRISILVASADKPDQYFELFYRDQIPLNTGPFLDLVPTLLDLQQIVSSDRINLRIRMQLRAPTPVFVESRLDYAFFGELQR